MKIFIVQGHSFPLMYHAGEYEFGCQLCLKDIYTLSDILMRLGYFSYLNYNDYNLVLQCQQNNQHWDFACCCICQTSL